MRLHRNLCLLPSSSCSFLYHKSLSAVGDLVILYFEDNFPPRFYRCGFVLLSYLFCFYRQIRGGKVKTIPQLLPSSPDGIGIGKNQDKRLLHPLEQINFLISFEMQKDGISIQIERQRRTERGALQLHSEYRSYSWVHGWALGFQNPLEITLNLDICVLYIFFLRGKEFSKQSMTS